MSSWSVNAWPWGGVKLCLNEQETKTVFAAEDAASGLASVVAGATILVPPLAAAFAIIAGFISLEKGVAELTDKGNGICLLASWAAIAAGEPLLVVPLANGSQPSQPFSNDQQHLNYLSQDGQVHELLYSGSGPWKHNVLSGPSFASVAQNLLPVATSGLDGYATPWNKQEHVNYLGRDSKVHELYYTDGGNWQHNVLNDLASADDSLAVFLSPLDGYATLWNNQQHVNYIGQDGQVHELLYSDPGPWQHNVLSGPSFANVAQNLLPVTGSILDGYATPWNAQQHVNYIGKDGKVHELWYSDSGHWQHNVLNDLASADNQLPSLWSPLDGYATPWNNQQHVNYIGQDGKLHELLYSDPGPWKHNILSDLANADDKNSLPVYGGRPYGYVT
jgi:hypothetical protein